MGSMGKSVLAGIDEVVKRSIMMTSPSSRQYMIISSPIFARLGDSDGDSEIATEIVNGGEMGTSLSCSENATLSFCGGLQESRDNRNQTLLPPSRLVQLRSNRIARDLIAEDGGP